MLTKERDKSAFETLGDRLKSYEADWEQEIDVDHIIVIRIDGHKFSKFTKGFKRPFDAILSKAMEETTKNLLKEFHAVVGYTQSDEITLIISNMTRDNGFEQNKEQLAEHHYNGRIQKLASLASGFATMSFNRALSEEVDNFVLERLKDQNGVLSDYEALLCNKLYKAWFDARVYAVDSDIEAFNSVLWRIRDSEKNSRSAFAQAYCSHKELQNMSGKEQVEFCKNKTGHDWEEIEDRYKYGILVKKEKFFKDIEISNDKRDSTDGTGGKSLTVERTRIKSWSQKLNFSNENVEMIMSKVITREEV